MPIVEPSQPVPGGRAHAILGLLMEKPHTAAQLGEATGVPEIKARGTLDQLRRLGWLIENRGGVYRLADPRFRNVAEA